MATTTRVLDDVRFESRARIGDIVALALTLVIGGALLFSMYSLGYSAGEVARTGGGQVFARDRTFVYMLIEVAALMGAFSWIVYRLFTANARRAGG